MFVSKSAASGLGACGAAVRGSGGSGACGAAIQGSGGSGAEVQAQLLSLVRGHYTLLCLSLQSCWERAEDAPPPPAP